LRKVERTRGVVQMGGGVVGVERRRVRGRVRGRVRVRERVGRRYDRTLVSMMQVNMRVIR